MSLSAMLRAGQGLLYQGREGLEGAMLLSWQEVTALTCFWVYVGVS